MSDHVVIKSADRGAVLELCAPTSAGPFRARLRGEGFDGTVEVYELAPPIELAEFFRDLADHWRGWSGDKRWGSLEDHLCFTATSDSTGHTHLVVELRSGPFYDWCLRGSLIIEAGQLEQIAAEVERFVSYNHAA